VKWPGPDLGQHTAQVLAERAGVDAAAYEGLKARGIV